jgi:hypothetical protein
MVGVLLTKARKNDFSDDQGSVDRDSYEDTDGQDPNDQDFDDQQSINENSEDNDQARAGVGID